MNTPHSPCVPCNSLYFPELGGRVHLCLTHTGAARPINMSTGRCEEGQKEFEAGRPHKEKQ